MRPDEISERLQSITSQTSSSQLALTQPLAAMLGPQLIDISVDLDGTGTIVFALAGGVEVWVVV